MGHAQSGQRSSIRAFVQDYFPLPRLLLLAALTAATLVTHLTHESLELAATRGPVGLTAVALGLALVAWALWTLGIGMLGGVESLAPSLVTRGPYRWVRHPVYVGMILALVGYAIAAASWQGLVATALLVVPAAVFRAGREDAALARRFPADWPVYRALTGAWLPRMRWDS